MSIIKKRDKKNIHKIQEYIYVNDFVDIYLDEYHTVINENIIKKLNLPEYKKYELVSTAYIPLNNYKGKLCLTFRKLNQ